MAKKLTGFQRRRQRVRNSIKKYNKGGRLRLSIHKSGKHMYAQLIDDVNSVTLASASTLDKEVNAAKTSTVEAAHKVGELIAKRAKEANVETVVFDRGGFVFHGRVRAVAEGARSAGLVF